MDTKYIGRLGEDIAAKFLKKQGYIILCQNWRCSFGEIDIVAQEKDFIIFIEIKTRGNLEFGPGYLSVGRAKQNKLIKLAQAFFKRYSLSDKPCRIDIVSIDLDRDNKPVKIELIRDAFWEN